MKINEEERQKFCRFGNTQLPILDSKDPKAYRPLKNLPLDENQKCLLDAIWKANSSGQKQKACCALQYYFSKIMQPPMGKNFSYYALVNGPDRGIYCYYSSLMKKTVKLAKPKFKGFYAFNDALDYILQFTDWELGETLFIEEEPREGPLTEVYKQEIMQLQKDMEELEATIQKLKREATDQEEEQEPIRHSQRKEEGIAAVYQIPESEDEDRRNPRYHRSIKEWAEGTRSLRPQTRGKSSHQPHVRPKWPAKKE